MKTIQSQAIKYSFTKDELLLFVQQCQGSDLVNLPDLSPYLQKPDEPERSAEEILKPYEERPFRHTIIIDRDNALKAMHEFRSLPTKGEGEIRKLLMETALRNHLCLPETEEEEKWFNETCDITESGDFLERLFNCLGKGKDPFPPEVKPGENNGLFHINSQPEDDKEYANKILSSTPSQVRKAAEIIYEHVISFKETEEARESCINQLETLLEIYALQSSKREQEWPTSDEVFSWFIASKDVETEVLLLDFMEFLKSYHKPSGRENNG
jgi:hypothetical protein